MKAKKIVIDKQNITTWAFNNQYDVLREYGIKSGVVSRDYFIIKKKQHKIDHVKMVHFSCTKNNFLLFFLLRDRIKESK